MTITQVLYVLETARQKSISKAAESLYISQPALSSQIKSIEKELGYTLFRRNSEGIFLSEEGKEFCKEARHVESAWIKLMNASKEIGASGAKSVRIGLDVRALANDYLDYVTDFFDRRPEIDVSVSTDMKMDILEELDNGNMDMAIGRMPPAELLKNKKRFHVVPLMSERQCILMSPHSEERNRKLFPFKDLNGKSVVCGPKGSIDDYVMKTNRQIYGVDVSHIHRADDIEAAMLMVNRSMGYSLGPGSFAEYFNVCAVPMIPEIYIDLNFICRLEDKNNPIVTQMESYLIKNKKNTQKG